MILNELKLKVDSHFGITPSIPRTMMKPTSMYSHVHFSTSVILFCYSLWNYMPVTSHGTSAIPREQKAHCVKVAYT